MCTPLDVERPNFTWKVTHIGRGLVLRVSHAIVPRGPEPQRIPIFGVLLYLCLYLFTQNDHVQQGNTYGEGRTSWGQPRLPFQGGWPPAAFPIFRVLFYLCLQPLTQNDHVRQANTYGEGPVSCGEPRFPP